MSVCWLGVRNNWFVDIMRKKNVKENTFMVTQLRYLNLNFEIVLVNIEIVLDTNPLGMGVFFKSIL